MSERKIRSDCMRMAPCGKTSRTRCLKIHRLPECEGCKLIRRIYANWVMIDRKPMIICKDCGRTLPLEDYYYREIKRGKNTYSSYDGTCKACRKKHYKEMQGKARASPEN